MAGEIPSGQGSVFHFLDIFALGCGWRPWPACTMMTHYGRLWHGSPGPSGSIYLERSGLPT